MTHSLPPPARIALVDDHPVIGAALASTLAAEHRLLFIGQATTVQEMHHLLAHQHPDLLMLDLSMADGNGLELLPLLRALHRHLPVLVYSMGDPRLYAERAIRAGAAGYVCKDAPIRDVLDALHTVLRGELYLPPIIARRLLRSCTAPAAPQPSPLMTLSNRELAVLHLLGHGNTPAEISQHLNVSLKTVKRAQRQIQDKLGLHTRGALLYAAMHVAYGST
ncbi:MAG: DNA-binding response regulator, partial [Bacteroidetes bacterium]